MKELYLIPILYKIGIGLTVISVLILALIMVMCIYIYIDSPDEEDEKAMKKKVIKLSIVVFIIGLLAMLFTTKEFLYQLIGNM